MDNFGEIIIYQTEDGLTKIDVNMRNETVWLSLDQMVQREATVANFATVQNEGGR